MTFDEMLAAAKAQGKEPCRRASHEEEDLQIACRKWFDLQWGEKTVNGEKIGPLLHHSPNGGKRTVREAARFKAMGTRAGFPDLWLGVPVGDCPYLCLELKTLKKGSAQSTRQHDYERLVKAVGARYVVVRTLQEFITAVNDYLKPLGL